MSGDQQIERQIKKLQIPEIDVHDKVMGRINRMQPPQKMLNKRLMIIAVTALLFLIGTGFASVTFINLYDENGSIALSIKSFNDDNQKSVLTEEASRKYLSLIMPGEAIAIYNPEGNPQNIVSILEKPIEITNFELFGNIAKNVLPLPESISGQFVFVKGVVHHVVDYPDVQNLISKSQLHTGDVVFEKTNVTTEIYGVTMTISMNGDEYLASMHKGERWDNVYTDFENVKQTKAIKVLGSEGLLMFEEGKVIFMLRLNNGDKDVFYHVTTNETSKDIETNLVLLMEQLINN